MNGFRVARKIIEQMSEKDLHGLYEAAKNDNDYAAVVVTHIIECEMEDRKEKRMKEIMKALRGLGAGGIVTTKHITTGRFAVYLDGEYFGIWDTIRQTFVD